MRDMRRLVGALCIVLSMVLGAVAGFVYVRPGATSAPTETGTRTANLYPIAADEYAGLHLGPSEGAETAESPESSMGVNANHLGIGLSEPGSPDRILANRLTRDDFRAMFERADRQFGSHDGVVSVRTEESKTDTRSHLSGGFDAGGPYGGADTFEGTDLTIQVTVYDPAIIFFRYDLDNDGIFDIPDQQGGGTLGRWTTQTVITHTFNDNAFGNILVEGWDGVSTFIVVNNGPNLGETTAAYWGITPANSGQMFTPKGDLLLTALGEYQFFVYRQHSLRIWDYQTQALLAVCTPVQVPFQWNWCTLSSSITVQAGRQYIISEHRDNDYWDCFCDYFLALNGLPNPQPERVTFGNFFYHWGPWGGGSYDAFPDTDAGDWATMMIDFDFTETLVYADAAQDTASIEVNNVAPNVFGVQSEPSPGLEGSAVKVSAQFFDPGLDDEWQYRWTFHDGTQSPWQDVTKYNGGAKVLILHTLGPDVSSLVTKFTEACATFCVKINVFDWGPTGESRVPTLSELLPYNVLLLATNYFVFSGTNEMGDRLADYMDAGGNVVALQGVFDSFWGCWWGICGRWETDGYSPLPRAQAYGPPGSIGTIYVPGHPLLDGVSSMSVLGIDSDIFDVNEDAIRIADYTNDRVLAAVKTNPNVDNGARAVALNFFPLYGYASGDYARMIANAVRWASQQPEPVLKVMPFDLDPYSKTYKDDDPTTTTLEDTFPVHVEVRDDDDGKFAIVSKDELFFNNFNKPAECSGFWGGTSNWPTDWYADPDGFGWVCGDSDWLFGSRGPDIWWYYNDPNYGTGDGISNLYTNNFDLSGYTGVRIEFYTWWQADYFFGTSDGYLEASLDGGATWDIVITEYHHNDPGAFIGDYVTETTVIAGYSNVVFRFRYVSNDDIWWFVDNFRVTGFVGRIMEGLGATDGEVTIANVPPTVIGPFDSTVKSEGDAVLFKGFRFDDPAGLEPTEWYAYGLDLDDGTPVQWRYVGTLAPPKFKVLIVHSFCLTGDSNGCPFDYYKAYKNLLLSLDDVGSVDSFNIINWPLPQAPTLDLLMQYDLIVLGTYWGDPGGTLWTRALRNTAEHGSEYLDSGRGGVLTTLFTTDNIFGSDGWRLSGRFIEDKYQPFKVGESQLLAVTLGDVDADHEAVMDVRSGHVTALFNGADSEVTVGGNNQAAGVSGLRIASWDNDSPAVGVKELLNGRRTVDLKGRFSSGSFGGLSTMGGDDLTTLVRNMLGWAAGGIPNTRIPSFTHTFGDNGIYNVDFMTIDDDMGFVWDFANNEPLAVLPGTSVSHRFVTVAVNNVEPVILPGQGGRSGIEAFIAAQVCVRISGTSGNSVTANFYTDGVLSASTSVTRQGGSPNPTDEKCGLLKVDVTAAHVFSADLTYSAPMGGSNPTWLVIAPWRDPVSPGHGTVTYKFDFGGSGTTVTQALPTLKQDLVEGGQGAKIDFAAEAYDPGTDDLAFLWAWDATGVVPYDPGASNSVMTIHVHHNDGTLRTDGVLDSPEYLGFTEPYFDRATNDGRSPWGTMDMRVRDTAVHAFGGGQLVYYVFLMVLDDDNNRGYASSFLHDGIDIEYILVDLR